MSVVITACGLELAPTTFPACSCSSADAVVEWSAARLALPNNPAAAALPLLTISLMRPSAAARFGHGTQTRHDQMRILLLVIKQGPTALFCSQSESRPTGFGDALLGGQADGRTVRDQHEYRQAEILRQL
jgi:hypothetical protein